MSLLEELKEQQSEEQKQIEEVVVTAPQNERGVLSQAVMNTPQSALQFGKDLITPILNPIETAKSLKDLGVGVYQLFTPGKQPNEELAKAVGQYFANRYGSLEKVKNTFANDPVGFAGDASILFTGGTTLAAKVPGFAGKTTSTINKIGQAIDPVTPITKGAGMVANKTGNVLADVLGMTTGAGGDAIKGAVSAGKSGGDAQRVLIDNMRGNAAADDVVGQAFNSLNELKKSKSQNYKSGMDAVKAAKTKVNFDGIETAYKNVLDDFTIQTKKGPVLKGGADLQKKFNEINKLIKQWKNNPDLHLAENVDALKQAVDSLWKPGKESVVVTKVRKAIHDEIVKQVPKYADTMKSYEKAIKFEKEIMKELSLNNKAAAGTVLRKLQSVMRNNASTNYGARLELLKNLDPDLLPALAGQSLNQLTPRGIQRVVGGGQVGAGALGYVDPLTLIPSLAIQSPRLVGETALKLGQGQRLLNKAPIKDTLRTTRPFVSSIEESEEQARLNYLNNLLNQ
tara:strand:- start:50 stop:1582 length:1533 start_codon:yes stop_codon:yes gene_type:complete